MLRDSFHRGMAVETDVGARASEERFITYVESLAQVLDHVDRAGPLKDYCTGLLMPGERKSVEPIASVVAPTRVSAEHQSLLHFVGQSAWSDESLLAKVRELVVPAMETQGRIEAWIVDDTGFVKKGVHSVGVARQYCGRLGKTDNCQVAVSLSIAHHAASLPIAYRLYLPKEWADDAARRRKAHVPDDVKFQTKPEIALAQMKATLAAGVARGVVLADPAYGSDGGFRAGVTAMGLTYAVGVQSTITVWPAGKEPLPPKPWSGRGRKPSRVRRDAEHRPVSAKTLATTLPQQAWREVSWREGSNQTLTSRFAAVRIRPASRDWKLAAPHPLEWLLIEWPEGEGEPTKYWLSTLPEDTPIEALVDTAKLRWRIERDYEELKSELGLAHFEGRGWRGFHHHATLCIATYGFLIRERAAFPPSAPRGLQGAGVSGRPRPRGAPDPTRAPRRKLDRHPAKATDRRPRQIALPMPVLPILHAEAAAFSALVTQ
jgi:SRSO17 transposase